MTQVPTEIFSSGLKLWKNKKGQLHRNNDEPALTCSHVQCWCENGEWHRDGDLPALVYSNGTKKWYQHGKLHRVNNKPAAIFHDGRKQWWKNGVRIKMNYIEGTTTIIDLETEL